MVKRKKELSVHINFEPHAGQRLIMESNAQYKYACTGRRFGKSTLADVILTIKSLEKEGLYWFCGPTYEVEVLPRYREFRKAAAQLIKKEYKQELLLEMINGSLVQFHSLQNYENKRGAGLSGLIVDEAAKVKEDAMTYVLLPSLMDHDGWMVCFSTPAGRNWFWREWCKGQEGIDGHESWRFSSYDNPYLSIENINKMRAKLTAFAARQEIDAEFLDDSSRPLRNLDVICTARRAPSQIDRRYVAGVDLGRRSAFTWVSVMDDSGEWPVEVELWRMNRVSWQVIYAGIVDRVKRYHTTATVDSTGIGDVIVEDLERGDLAVGRVPIEINPYFYTPKSKEQLIDNLITRCDAQTVRFLSDEDSNEALVANNEMKAFERTLNATGRIWYHAPPGSFDDAVNARALALMGCRADGQRVSESVMDGKPIATFDDYAGGEIPGF